MDNIILYFIGAAISCCLINIWLFTNIALHIGSFLRLIKKEDEIDSRFDLQLWIENKSAILGELLHCPFCLGFWVSLAVSYIIFYLNNLSLWFILSSAFSWPLLIYFTYGLCKYISKL